MKILGHGPSYSPIMIIADYSNLDDSRTGQALSGQARKLIDSYLKKAGHDGIDSCYVTNLYKYPAPYFKSSRIHETNDEAQSQDELYREIRAINPNVIVPLGDYTLRVLTGKTGIKHHRGSILNSQSGHKVIPTIHPLNIYANRDKDSDDNKGDEYIARIYIQEDFKKAIRESLSKEHKTIQRQITIARRPEDLFQFLKMFEKYFEFATDIESLRGIPTCISLSFIKESALVVPLMNLKPSASFPKIPDTYLVQFLQTIDKLLQDPRFKIIGQNLKYDYEKLQRILGIYPNHPYLDTSILAKTLYPELPKSLEFLTSVHTNEPYYKFEGKEFNLKKDKVEQLYTYNGKDGYITLEISQVLRKHLDDFENKYPGIRALFYNFRMKLHPLYMDIERVGFKVDHKMRQELYGKYLDLTLGAWRDASELAGKKINISSPKQVAHFLYDIMGLPERNNAKESTITMLYANHADTEAKKKACLTVLKGRRYRKTLGTYVMKEPDFDGRMRTSYDIAGKETTRSSTRVLKPPLRPYKNIGLAFHTISKHGDIGQDVGYMLVADEGYEIINFDLSQAEPRIVANLSEDYDLLARFDRIDIHKESAGVCFELDSEEAQRMDKEDIRRFVGKTVKNGVNYDMRKGRMAQTINDDALKFHINIRISESESGEMLQRVHTKYPKVREVFHEGIKRVLVDNNMTMVDPWGGIRQFFGRWGDQVHKEAYANLPQRTVTGQVQRAMLDSKKRKPEMLIVTENHDSFAILSKLDERLENIGIVTELMEREIDFSRCSLPRDPLKIPCGVEIALRYNQFSKWVR